MKIEIYATDFRGFLEKLALIIPDQSPSPLPIYEHVVLEADEQGLWLTGGDNEVQLRVGPIACRVIRQGSAMVNGRLLSRVVKRYPAVDLNLESDQGGVQIWGSLGKVAIRGPETVGYPKKDFDCLGFEILAGSLRALVSRTNFAVCRENNRYSIGGVLLEAGIDGLWAVATDGRRIAAKRVESRYGLAVTQTIVPARAVELISLLLIDPELDEMPAWVSLNQETSEVVVRSQYWSIWTRAIEGRFPKWRDCLLRAESPVGSAWPRRRAHDFE